MANELKQSGSFSGEKRKREEERENEQQKRAVRKYREVE